MTSFTTSLEYQDLLEVSGEDSGKFLQGQLTCDLEKLSAGHCMPGAACNNKGRVYASFRVFRVGDNYYLGMQPGLLKIAQTVLQKYIPFYKATMADAAEKYRRFGLIGEAAEAALKTLLPALPGINQSAKFKGSIVFNTSTRVPRYEIWQDPAQEDVFAPVRESLEQAETADWEEIDLDAGVCLIHPQDSELYTPEELNLDLAGFVSFDKGCYTGQEIVARMHYRGKAKKRLYVVSLETSQEITDKTLSEDSDKALSNIFNLLYLNNNIAKGFAVLKTETEADAAYWLNANGSKLPVTLTALLY